MTQQENIISGFSDRVAVLRREQETDFGLRNGADMEQRNPKAELKKLFRTSLTTSPYFL